MTSNPEKVEKRPDFCIMLTCPLCKTHVERPDSKNKSQECLSSNRDQLQKTSGTDLKSRWDSVRDAQRLVRKQTKDQFDILEKTIAELKRSQEVNHALALETRRLNVQLEDENIALRLKLQEATVSINMAKSRGKSLLLHHFGVVILNPALAAHE